MMRPSRPRSKRGGVGAALAVCSNRHRCWSEPNCWSFVGERAVRVLDGWVYSGRGLVGSIPVLTWANADLVIAADQVPFANRDLGSGHFLQA